MFYACSGRVKIATRVVLPLLEEYFVWLKMVHPEKGSKLEDAVRYSLSQKQQLMAFLDYGDVHISNNLAENAIRPFVVGRKNWLFCDSVTRERNPALSCTRWWRQPRPTESSHTNTCC